MNPRGYAPLVLFCVQVACSTGPRQLAPGEGVSCGSSCVIGGANGGTTTTDGGESGDTSISLVTGTVRSVGSFTDIPDASAPLSGLTNQTVQFYQGGVLTSVPAADGTFTITNADAAYPYLWLYVTTPQGYRTIAGVNPANTQGLILPVYPAQLGQQLAQQYAGGGVNTNAASLVIHLLSTAGQPIVGAVGSTQGTTGPFYDNGAGGIVVGNGTGAQGTLVYVGVNPGSAGSFSVTVTYNGTTTSLPGVPLQPNAVTSVNWVLTT